MGRAHDWTPFRSSSSRLKKTRALTALTGCISSRPVTLTRIPLIVRVEDGNLKVDWEIYSEFFDRIMSASRRAPSRVRRLSES